MQALKEYLLEEYRDRAKGYVACEYKFAHSTRIKPDKASGVSLKVDVVKVGLRFVDRDMNTLLHSTITFENNVIPKSKEKSFINISPKELNNKFAFARSEVVRSIMDEYVEKRDELNTKIAELKAYLGNASDVITPQMKGEVVNVADTSRESTTKRAQFDM